jgi:hypothetical protein
MEIKRILEALIFRSPEFGKLLKKKLGLCSTK